MAPPRLTVLPQDAETLPSIIDAARTALAGARTSAEVLEAREMASAAYDLAARFTRRKAAFDHMTALAMRMQAQALRIEARAKERLADEYDAAQERGDVAGHGRPRKVSDADLITVSSLGLRKQEIHEARRIRDAERADPGTIDRAIDARLEAGLPPTRAALKRDLGLSAPAPPPEAEISEDAWVRGVGSYVDALAANPLCGLFFSASEEELGHVVRMLRKMDAGRGDALRRAAAGLQNLVKEMDDEGL